MSDRDLSYASARFPWDAAQMATQAWEHDARSMTAVSYPLRPVDQDDEGLHV
ncbi:hypothetical protein [Microbacterium murale]|uniref:Uncharacterized protein n=1 Tax=Microbacterium murale TaxID=1081040 RepID=A0ABU0PAJ8_9MICO|nr:hypothetical protein [Microbacterium murale]MDQ0644360.1 hypothetical protein [Microbacterium murale]